MPCVRNYDGTEPGISTYASTMGVTPKQALQLGTRATGRRPRFARLRHDPRRSLVIPTKRYGREAAARHQPSLTSFGEIWVQRRIEALKSPITLHVREVLPDKLPLEDNYDIITVLEVYEHLRNPSEVTIHLCDHLRRGGLLWENYIVHNHPHASDLEVAQRGAPSGVRVFEPSF